MNKPNAYDETKSSGSFEPVEVGGHYAMIKKVEDTKSKTNKEMVVVYFDFCVPDKQEKYFTNAFRDDVREDKKWPFTGTKYIMVEDFNGKDCSKAFKGFCEAFEKSNGISIQWGIGNWEKQFTNKKIGVVYGLEENEYNNKRTMRPAPKWFCEFNNVPNQKIPEPKYLKNSTAPIAGELTDISDEDDSDLPF